MSIQQAGGHLPNVFLSLDREWFGVFTFSPSIAYGISDSLCGGIKPLLF